MGISMERSIKSQKDFPGCGIFKIKDGSHTRFWEDTWVGSRPDFGRILGWTQPLKEQFPSLFNIVNYPRDKPKST
jgi:hypothetical protein